MSDFEQRVTEALRGGAASAPDGLGLAGAARSRARARRRTRATAVGVVAVAALAVPVAVVALGGDDDAGGDRVADDPSTKTPAPQGRWESWHGITVRVPDDWQYGNQMTWCASGGSADQFLITRPGGVTEAIACTPGSSYGLSFQDVPMKATDEPFDWPVVTQTGDSWPPHTYMGAHGEDGVLVTVAGPESRQLLDVLATVRSIEDVDPNGCPATADSTVTGDADSVSVCRYETSGALVQSERLTDSNATDARAALAAAPGMPYTPECPALPELAPPVEESVVIVDGSQRYEVVYQGDTCPSQGVFIGDDERRELTPDVLWWALSPGWTGSVGPGVPMPSVLRSYDPAG